MKEWMTAIQDWVVGNAGQPWTYAVTALLCWIDGFFPPLPSESVIIGMASLAMTGGRVSLVLLALAAILGGFLGDQTAYWIGRKVPLEKLFRGERGAKVLAKAQHLLHHKGPTFLISGRYIPGYRVAINMVAGTVRLPYRRFVWIDLVSTTLWVCFTIAIGAASGRILKGHPLLAIVVGVALGLVLGVVIDKLVGWWEKRSGSRADENTANPAPTDAPTS